MERGRRERTTEVTGASASSGVRTNSQGEEARKRGGHGAPLDGHGSLLPPCLAEENSKGERENAEEGRDIGVHFKSSAHVRGELAGMQTATTSEGNTRRRDSVRCRPCCLS